MNKIAYLEKLAEKKNSPELDTLLGHYEQMKGCPVTATMRIVGGKWKPIILFLIQHRVNRFSELSKLIDSVSKKVLTDQLRELEADGVLFRQVYPERKLKVEYGLTEKGETLMPIIAAMCDWGLEQ